MLTCFQHNWNQTQLITPTSTMPTTVHIVRHAQGYHNLSNANQLLPDPELTPLGEEQCAHLRRSFDRHDKITRTTPDPLFPTTKILTPGAG